MFENKRDKKSTTAKAKGKAQKKKNELHPKNRHRDRYNFKLLVESLPELSQFVITNKYDDESIDFSNPEAVKMLNKALLKHFYGIEHWNIPTNYLCPPIPGRVDYIHHIAELLSTRNGGIVPTGNQIKCLDIGMGANCIYPLVGNKEYGWSFTGSDIDPIAIESAKNIIELNPSLKEVVELRLQTNSTDLFNGIIQPGERFHLTVCNPPFHSTQAEAQAATLRKLSNLNKEEITKPVLNFGGMSNELWCFGGEEKFVTNMVLQSKQFATSCFWFSTLISKQANLDGVYKSLKKAGAVEVKTIPMGQGNKISRIVAWTFLSNDQQKEWKF